MSRDGGDRFSDRFLLLATKPNFAPPVISPNPISSLSFLHWHNIETLNLTQNGRKGRIKEEGGISGE